MSAECQILPFELPTFTSSLKNKREVESQILRLVRDRDVDSAKRLKTEPVTVKGRLTVSF